MVSYDPRHAPRQTVPSSLPASQSMRGKLTDAFLLVVVLAYALPEAWTSGLSIGPLKLLHLISALALTAMALESLQYLSRLLVSPIFHILTALFCLMCLVGGLTSSQLPFEWRVFGYDAITFGGMLAAFCVALGRPAEYTLALIRRLAIAWTVLLCMLVLGLVAGAINPVWRNFGRIHTWSMFHCLNGILLCLPILAVHGRPLSRFRNLGQRARHGLTVFLWSVAPLVANFFAGSRSIFVLHVAGALVCLPIAYRGRGVKGYALLTTCFVGSLTFALLAFDQLSPQSAVIRLQSTNLGDEQRSLEIKWLLYSLEDHWTEGLGFGSMFPSPVRFNREENAAFPHVAILTTLQKGGVIAFSLFLATLLVAVLRGLLKFASSPSAYSFSASIFLYVILSSMSGGWAAYSERCRSAFRTDADRDSNLMPITIPK